MKRILYIAFAFVAAIMVASCDEKVEEGFSFSIKSETVEEGQALPFTVTISRGEHSGYRMSVDIKKYDMETGAAEDVEDYEVLCDGEPLKERVNFDDFGRKEFTIVGLGAGTYRIKVRLTRDSVSVVESVVTVVYEKYSPGPGPGPEPGPEPSEDIPVAAISFPDMTLVEGRLWTTVGDENRFVLSWEPADATLINFSVVSSDENVVVAAISSGVLSVNSIAAGEATLTVSAEGGASARISVVVKPVDVDVDSFEIHGLVLTDGKLVLEDPETKVLTLSWLPINATKTGFTVRSSDSDVVAATVNGNQISLQTVYPGDATVTVTSECGLSESFVVRVHKNVNVTIAWEEAQATDVQIATKTFPCDLVVSSDSQIAFPEPIVFSLVLEGTVNVTGHDSETKTVQVEGRFNGNPKWRYNVSSNFLQPCYMIYRTSDFSLSIRMSLQHYDTLDKDFWTVNFIEEYKTQSSRINQYISAFE